MKCVVLIPLAFMVQASTEQTHATAEKATAEDEEAMNQLIDILVDDEKNDELVDMIADKLVNKLLGFETAVLPQSAQAMMAPAAEVRQFMRTPPQVQQAPQVNVAYDNSKNVKIGEGREGMLKGRNTAYNAVPNSQTIGWGVGATIKGGVNPYGAAYPALSERTSNKALNNIDMSSKYKPGPEYQNLGSADYERLKGLKGFGAGREIDSALDYLQGVDRGAKPKLMEMDEEEPDALTVVAVGLLSACVGSAATLALFHFGRRAAKTGMQAPLLTQ